MNDKKAQMVTVLLVVCIILFFSTLVCEEGGLLDTQPLPPIFKTERAATLTR